MKQRKIKFRYILKHKGKIKVVYATLEEIEQGKMDDYLMQKSEKFRNKNNVIARNQYVGRKDKNDKEIYEEDITNYGVIKWCEYLNWDTGGSLHPGFYFKSEEGDLDYHKGFDNDIEVIGNITEIPKLLKK